MGPPEVNARGERPGPGPSARSSRPFGIAVDPEGHVWFSEQYGQKVGRLTPAPADILSPAGVVRSAEVHVRILTRHGTPPLSMRIDNREVPMADRLNLSVLAPGPHTLDVRLPGASRPVATSQFVVEPSLDAIVQMARRLGKDEATVATLSRALAAIREGRPDASREIVRSVLGPTLAAGHLDMFAAHLRHYDLFAQREYNVPLGSGPPPRVVSVEVGDAIVIANEGSTPIQVSVRDGDCAPEVVGVGRTFRHAFSREGIFPSESQAPVSRPPARSLSRRAPPTWWSSPWPDLVECRRSSTSITTATCGSRPAAADSRSLLMSL